MSRCGSRWLVAAVVLCACRASDSPARRVVFDFEDGDAPWRTVTGGVQGHPAMRVSAVRRHKRGFIGTGETASGKWDVALIGVLESPAFVIDHPYLVFRLGGRGSSKACRLELRSGEEVLKKIKNPGRWGMETHVVDVHDLVGTTVQLRLVDRGEADDPCAVHLDWVRLVDG